MKLFFGTISVLLLCLSLIFSYHIYLQQQLVNSVKLEPYNSEFWLHPRNSILSKEVVKGIFYSGQIMNVLESEDQFKILLNVYLPKPYPSSLDRPVEFLHAVDIPKSPANIPNVLIYRQVEDPTDPQIVDNSVDYLTAIKNLTEGDILSFDYQINLKGEVFIKNIEINLVP